MSVGFPAPGGTRSSGGRRSPPALADAGIGYEWQGEALGGRRSRSPQSRHTALRQAAFAGYADHMDTPEFRQAVAALVARAAAGERPAVLCAETVWWQCHADAIADALVLRGAAVTHLWDVGRRQEHRLHPDVRRGRTAGRSTTRGPPLPGL